MCEECGCGEKDFNSQVQEVIESIKPMLQNDGGDIELVDGGGGDLVAPPGGLPHEGNRRVLLDVQSLERVDDEEVSHGGDRMGG